MINTSSTFSLNISRNGGWQQTLHSRYTPSDLASQLLNIGAEVDQIVREPLFAAPGILADNDQNSRFESDLQKSMDRVATTGWKLHEFLSSDDAFAIVLKDVESLPPGQKIVIHTDRFFIPWKILYSAEFHYNLVELGLRIPAQRQLFWGYQHIIEVRLLLSSSEAKSKNYRRIKAPRKFVSLNIAPGAEQDLATTASDAIWSHSHFFQSRITPANGEFTNDPAEIKKLLTEKRSQAGLIYFYCHGSNEKPFQPGQMDKLELAKGDSFGEELITSTSVFNSQPVVFLNSCSSGAFPPLSFNNFHRKFRSVGVQGMIVTDFAVPILVGAVVGQRVIKSYLDGFSLGRALLDLTRSLLDRNNPVGLFYSLQCPMDFTAQDGKAVA
jgi:hypothetical protein